MPEIQIPYEPRYPEIHRILDTHRFCVLVAHRRFGKTVLAINHLLRRALLCDKPRGCYGYVSPFLKQTKKVAWAYLKHYTRSIPSRRINESELRIDLPNDASIWLHGADNPDSLRGSYLDGVVMDEVAQMKASVWGEIIQPMLADRLGWAVFIGTPKGANLFSDLYHSALKRQQDGDPDWAALLFPVTRTNALPEAEVARLKRESTENQFRQEFLCDFTATNDNNLLDANDVMDAMERHIDPALAAKWNVVIGVDIARFGDDATVFFARQGLQAFEPVVFHKLGNVDVAHLLIGYIQERNPYAVCIDQGQGTGVIDIVRAHLDGGRPAIHDIPFGSRALEADRYVNRRAEMWCRLRDWIKAGGALPYSTDLLAELTAPEYSFDAQGKIRLEKKDDVKKRLGGKSTDLADALALTFALPDSLQTSALSGQSVSANRAGNGDVFRHYQNGGSIWHPFM